MLLLVEHRVPNEEEQTHLVDDYGRTVRDMNKIIKQTSSKLGALHPMSTFSTSGMWRHLPEISFSCFSRKR